MKKFFSSLICAVLAVITALLLVPREVTFAADEKIYNLISPTYNNGGPENSKSKYNISEVSNYTPRLKDKDGKLSKLPGMSFVLEADESAQIIDQTIFVEDADALETNEGVSLYFWINLDKYDVHDFYLKLEFENGAYVEWMRSSYEFTQDLLGEESESSRGRAPWGWKLMEFPFAMKRNYSGDIVGQKMKSITFNFTSTQPSSIINYAHLTFYDIYVGNSKSTEIAVHQSQDYLIYQFKDMDETLLNNYVVGDSFKVPQFYETIEYIFYGDTDLMEKADFGGHGPLNYAWFAYIYSPDANESKRVFSQDTIELEETGTYRLVYECKDNAGNVLLRHFQYIKVREFSPIYFNKSSLSIEIGKKYIINASKSTAFLESTDFVISNVSDGLTVNYLGDGKIEIFASTSGNHSFSVSISGTRLTKLEQTNYEAEYKVFVSKPASNNRLIWRIVVISVLGVIGVVGLAILIKSLVKSKHFDVK